MNALQEFRFNQSNVRIVMIDDNPWWVAKDVCESIGIVWKGSHSLGALEQDEKGPWIIQTNGGLQEQWIINESGLYTLIMRSDKPEAKTFRKWVTSEVLPRIRKTGSYSLPIPQNQNQQILLLCQKLTEQTTALIAAESKLIEQQPAVNFYNSVSKATSLQSIRQVAKEIGTGEKKLFALLRECEILMKNNLPYQTYIDRGYFEVKCRDIRMGDQVVAYSQTFVTVKGLEWINNRFGRMAA